MYLCLENNVSIRVDIIYPVLYTSMCGTALANMAQQFQAPYLAAGLRSHFIVKSEKHGTRTVACEK